jgi:inner membrane protein
MASAFTHALVAAALGSLIVPGRARLIALGAALAILPDADAIGFQLGVPYASQFGHRGLSHSIAFAAVAALGAARLLPAAPPAPSRTRAALFLFAAVLSHGLLDALTNGGLGVAFFAPLSGGRFFFPWRPIAVSPISVTRFFTARGLRVLESELVVVWLPALALAGLGWLVRNWRRGDAPG